MDGRQWVITQARIGAFTNADMEQQLGVLTLQEVSLKRELSSLGHAININSLKDWETKLAEYFADLQAGIHELKNAAPQDDEEQRQVFMLKKQMIDTLVERATINKNREIKVEIRLDLLAILDKDVALAMPYPAYIDKAEIYTHTRSGLFHRRRCAFCG